MRCSQRCPVVREYWTLTAPNAPNRQRRLSTNLGSMRSDRAFRDSRHRRVLRCQAAWRRVAASECDLWDGARMPRTQICGKYLLRGYRGKHADRR